MMSVLFVFAAFGMMAIYDYPIIRYSLLSLGLAVCVNKRKQIITKFKLLKEGEK